MAVLYISTNREYIELTPETRAQFGGTFADLPSGVTHYELLGPKGAPTVVILHGSTISIWDFDLQVQPLVLAGYRVLRFDAFGRGLSDRPHVAYTRQLYIKQLKELLAHLNIDSPFVLLGHSLGGATAVGFASQYPQKVLGIALVSPVVDSVDAVAPFFVCNTPLLGPLLLRVGMMNVLRARAKEQWRGKDVDVQHYDDLFVQQSSIVGFEHAICSIFQTNTVGNYVATFKRLGALQIPGMMVYGGKDTAVRKHDVEQLREFLPHFSFREFPDDGHSVHVQRENEFNQILLKFLKNTLVLQ